MQYSLEQLARINRSRGYLSQERFLHYFVHRFGYSEKLATRLYQIFWKFPFNIHQESEIDEIDEIVTKCVELLTEIEDGFNLSIPKSIFEDYENKKIYRYLYKESEEEGDIKELTFNIFNAQDMITYAELLRRNVFAIALLSYCDTFSVQKGNKSEYLEVFEGDIFTTNEDYWNKPAELWVAGKKGDFHKVLYTQGRGYIRNGELDFDESEKGSSYNVTGKKYVKLGNYYTHYHLLIDDNIIKAVPDGK